MKQGSDYFFGQLLENQLAFAKSMNYKHSGKFYDVLRAWRMKETLPAYSDIALHKIVLQEFKHKIPKSTISTWIATIPELLGNKEKLDEILENSIVQKVEVVEKKLTKEEWDYLHRLEGEKINLEYRTLMEKLQNPKATDSELMQLTGASRRLMQKINNYGLTMTEPYTQKKLIEQNEKILMAGKDIILDRIDDIHIGNMRDLKALSGIMDDSLKQNQLLTGGPTERVAHGVDEIFEHMERKRTALESGEVIEGEIEVEDEDDFKDDDY